MVNVIEKYACGKCKTLWDKREDAEKCCQHFCDNCGVLLGETVYWRNIANNKVCCSKACLASTYIDIRSGTFKDYCIGR